jgi:hypothetical protein
LIEVSLTIVLAKFDLGAFLFPSQASVANRPSLVLLGLIVEAVPIISFDEFWLVAAWVLF